ncbi:hypothetical protein LCGC14_2855450, partial [marine sediment metagenome]
VFASDLMEDVFAETFDIIFDFSEYGFFKSEDDNDWPDCRVKTIERPDGDPARSIGPFYHDEADPEKSLFWFAFNTNKRGITLDIETADGQEVFKKLARTADVVVENFRPGVMDPSTLLSLFQSANISEEAVRGRAATFTPQGTATGAQVGFG